VRTKVNSSAFVRANGWDDVALDYRKTMPNAKLYYIPRAGHFIQFEQPELMTRVILAFLLDQPDTISLYSGDADPRTLP
jgi:hypothetical protein